MTRKYERQRGSRRPGRPSPEDAPDFGDLHPDLIRTVITCRAARRDWVTVTIRGHEILGLEQHRNHREMIARREERRRTG